MQILFCEYVEQTGNMPGREQFADYAQAYAEMIAIGRTYRIKLSEKKEIGLVVLQVSAIAPPRTAEAAAKAVEQFRAISISACPKDFQPVFEEFRRAMIALCNKTSQPEGASGVDFQSVQNALGKVNAVCEQYGANKFNL